MPPARIRPPPASAGAIAHLRDAVEPRCRPPRIPRQVTSARAGIRFRRTTTIDWSALDKNGDGSISRAK
jgi:hypothetical protein